jgi:hypothetical protein
MLKASVAGLGGLSLASLLEARRAAHGERRAPSQRSVILLWMAGGPSHIDTWDVKPDAPREIRGPFGTIPTKLPGVRLCEYLPKQAALLDRLTIIRSVDARGSNHEPNQVFQTGNREAEPRTNPRGDKYPAIASIAASNPGRGRLERTAICRPQPSRPLSRRVGRLPWQGLRPVPRHEVRGAFRPAGLA